MKSSKKRMTVEEFEALARNNRVSNIKITDVLFGPVVSSERDLFRLLKALRDHRPRHYSELLELVHLVIPR